MWNKEEMAKVRREERAERAREFYARAERNRPIRNLARISKKEVRSLYAAGKSAKEIGLQLHCSPHKVLFWMERYKIPRRTHSEATYNKQHPDGDPFRIVPAITRADAFLEGLGLGLYWGEGTRTGTTSIRLRNADPRLIRAFIAFLKHRYGARPEKFTFGLQVFSDIPPARARQYWCAALGVPLQQFQKVVVTPSRGIGTYRHRLENGVLTVYFHNRKLRDILVRELEKVHF